MNGFYIQNAGSSLLNNLNRNIGNFVSVNGDVVTIMGLKANGSIQLFDASGKFLLQRQVTEQTLTMNISAYAKGIYLLLYKQGGKISQQTIIKE